MISCKEATNYISQKEEGKLSFSQRLHLWQHLLICSFCRLFYKQNKVFINSIPHMDDNIDISLSQQEKDAMIAVLEGNA